MICPNCGKNTSKREKCDHCGMPTEFVRRTNPHSDSEPLFDSVPLSNRKGKLLMGILWILTVSTILTTIGIWMLVFQFSDKQKQRVVAMEGTVPTTEQTFEEGIETDVVPTGYTTAPTETLPIGTYKEKNEVCLFWNLPTMDNEWIDAEKAVHLTYGNPIPETPNIEGYIFCGWNTEPTGDGELYQLGSKLEIWWEGELVLYGQWKQVDPD